LWGQLAEAARRPLRPEHASWRGLRLWAADGTKLLVPEDLFPVFGAPRIRQGEGFAQAHLLVLYDLPTRVPVRCRLSRCDPDERPRAGPLFGRHGPATGGLARTVPAVAWPTPSLPHRRPPRPAIGTTQAETPRRRSRQTPCHQQGESPMVVIFTALAKSLKSLGRTPASHKKVIIPPVLISRCG
jgi:hypothetical protein